MKFPTAFVRRLLFGSDGPRWGLSLALFIALFALAVSAVRVILRALPVADPFSQGLGELGAFSAALAASLVMARIERRPWSTYGLPLRGATWRPLAIGAVWGIAGVTVLLGALHLLGAFDTGPLRLSGLSIAGYAAFWAALCLLVGLFEEFLVRGYAQFTLGRGIGFWPAALVLSALFGAAHLLNDFEAASGAVEAGLFALFMCLTLRRTGTLWFAVGMHAGWDWAESFLYSVPDSGTTGAGRLMTSTLHGPTWLTGGAVGPEGSVLMTVALALFYAAFVVTHPAPVAEPEQMPGARM